MPLLLEIVTPESRAYSETAESVVIPTTTGEIGVLPGHLPLLTQVEPGELRVQREGRTQYLAVGRGFAQISGDKVSVLAESAISEEKIDESAVEAAMKRAQDALAGEEALDPAEAERLEKLVRFAAAQLMVKKRKR
jgi:F-type H+-transporting ATPase subunit epsilon